MVIGCGFESRLVWPSTVLIERENRFPVRVLAKKAGMTARPHSLRPPAVQYDVGEPIIACNFLISRVRGFYGRTTMNSSDC